jgi:hypothetical protein
MLHRALLRNNSTSMCLLSSKTETENKSKNRQLNTTYHITSGCSVADACRNQSKWHGVLVALDFKLKEDKRRFTQQFCWNK